MIFIFVSLFLAIISFILHLFLYRLFKKYGKENHLLLAFPIFFILDIFTQITLRSNFLISSMLFFVCLVLFYLIYYFSSKTGEYSPSAVIYKNLSVRRNKMTKKEILSLFDSKALVSTRIKMLVDNGIVQKKKDGYKVSPAGKNIAFLVNLYRSLLGWEMGG